MPEKNCLSKVAATARKKERHEALQTGASMGTEYQRTAGEPQFNFYNLFFPFVACPTGLTPSD